jgi:flagellar protein FliT
MKEVHALASIIVHISSRSGAEHTEHTYLYPEQIGALIFALEQAAEAAQMADWNEVVRYEGACGVLIEQLRQRALTETMTAAERTDKTRIMQQILRNDAQVRLLIEPWVGELDKLLSPRIANEVH